MLRLAYVRDHDDRDGLGRVLLEYLGHEAASRGDWTPVATPMAGDQTGLFIMPEVDDLVVVGFINGDIDRPVVLGAIWNGAQKPPTDEIQKRCLVSRKGHSISLSDGDDDGIELHDRHGNRIVMNADGIAIETPGQLAISVAGDSVFETSGEATHTASTIKLNP